MARPCTICDHSARTAIDQALVAGEAPKMKQHETLSSRARARENLAPLCTNSAVEVAWAERC